MGTTDSTTEKNRRLLIRLGLVVVGMFVFVFIQNIDRDIFAGKY